MCNQTQPNYNIYVDINSENEQNMMGKDLFILTHVQ